MEMQMVSKANAVNFDNVDVTYHPETKAYITEVYRLVEH
jgi:hypothetical protein